MPREETTATAILAAYGELGLRLASAIAANGPLAATIVTEAAAGCEAPDDWLTFLVRVRETAMRRLTAERRDARRTEPVEPSAPVHRSEFTALPVDPLRTREALGRLSTADRELLFATLVGRPATAGEPELARVLARLHAEVVRDNFPSAEDIP